MLPLTHIFYVYLDVIRVIIPFQSKTCLVFTLINSRDMTKPWMKIIIEITTSLGTVIDNELQSMWR